MLPLDRGRIDRMLENPAMVSNSDREYALSVKDQLSVYAIDTLFLNPFVEGIEEPVKEVKTKKKVKKSFKK